MRRALLIGAQTFGLRGVDTDVAAVDALLAERGFDRRILRGGDADREGILGGLRALIDDTTPGDPVVLYYTGHGGRIANPRHSSDPLREPRHYACIIPTDHTRQEFRGIFSSELAAHLAELARRTANITVILDCCHASAQIKHAALAPKAIPIPWRDEIAAHRDWLLSQGYDLRARAAYVESNPHAIRLFACASEALAFEALGDDGAVGGLLTAALVEVLREVPENTPWYALAPRIKARLAARSALQIPEIHGPLGRLLFTAEGTTRTGILALIERDGRPHLSGGSLHGVTRGSRYLLMPINANRPDPTLALAEAEVLAIGPDHAAIALRPRDPGVPPPLGTLAFPSSPALRRHPVGLELPPGALHGAITAAIARSPRLSVIDPTAEHRQGTGEALATITLTGDRLTLRDHQGYPLRAPWPRDRPQDLEIGLLEQLARVRELLGDPQGPAEDPEGPASARLAPLSTLRWGVVTAGSPRYLPLVGAHLRAGDRIFLSVTSRSPVPIYVQILGVGISRAIRLLSRSQPTGVRLEDRETYTLGEDYGELLGLPLRWNPAIPGGGPQPMALLAVSSTFPVDLRPLESSCEEEDIVAELRSLLDPAGLGGAKDLEGLAGGSSEGSLRWARVVIRFTLAEIA